VTAQVSGKSPAHPYDSPLAFLGDRLRRDEPVGPLCTYRVGGAAARFVLVQDEAELHQIARALADSGSLKADAADSALSVQVIGRGSNLLLAEAGLPGLLIQLGEGFAQTLIEGVASSLADDERLAAGPLSDWRILRAGAMSSLPVVARRSVTAGLTGFEWAVGVPGSIGGAVRMNAGGHGADMAASLIGVRVIDLQSGENSWVTTTALELGYRNSSISSAQVVLSADLLLANGEQQLGEQRLSEIVTWRRKHQPGGQNAGSVFRNPPDDSAGRLIEAAGCRGLRIGTAEVSTKHANFIQVDPDGSSDDVLRLMVQMVTRVREHSGIQLHPETVLLGFDEASRSSLLAPRSRRPPVGGIP